MSRPRKKHGCGIASFTADDAIFEEKPCGEGNWVQLEPSLANPMVEGGEGYLKGWHVAWTLPPSRCPFLASEGTPEKEMVRVKDKR